MVRAQVAAYDITKDAKNGSVVFNGPITFDDLNKESSFTWLKTGAAEYNPRQSSIAAIKEQLNKGDFSIVVFLGTWCDDSKELVPKLEKVLMLAGFPMSKVEMYGVDREKTTKNGESKKFGITLVPTIILMRNGKETGRITETVNKSMEEDLVKLFH